MTGSLRLVAVPFVAAAPGGARVRARLRLPPGDEAVLRAVGGHLASLAGKDLAARCAEGRLDARGRARSRAVRKRALTAESSSRWAGAITRTSEDQVQLAGQNLRAGRASLQARIARIQARLAVPAGGRSGRVRGYASAAERHAKAVRLRSLQARLARVERQLEAGTVSVVRGGKALLPAPLARLANRPHGRYRLSAPVAFSYRGDQVAAQAASGAVRYDISCDPARGRWYIDASWKTVPAPAPALDELRARRW